MLALFATRRCRSVSADAESEKAASAVGVQMPLAKTFWTSSFGLFSGSFGVPWMVNAET